MNTESNQAIQSQQIQKASVLKRQRQNQVICNQELYKLFVKQDFESCIKLVNQLQEQYGYTHEFSNYIMAFILRQQGQISQSNEYFKKCLIINDKNQEVLKYISRNLFFMGKYKVSIDVAYESLRFFEDWETYFTLGQSYSALQDQKKSFEYFEKSYQMQKNEQTSLQIGRLYTIQERYKDAVIVYQHALQIAPQNTELMTVLGILYLRMGDNEEATKHLENSCALNGQDARSLTGLGSILQDRSDYDGALQKYRQILAFNPNSSQIWNNIGMCFYGKRKHIASIACLKKALYFDPFEWIIHFNLGLVHMATEQYASAYHFFSASISFRPSYAQAYMYLGLALNHLDDYSNCIRAMDKALQLEEDHLIYLNYCIILFQKGTVEEYKKALGLFDKFKKYHQNIQLDTRYSQEEILDSIKLIEQIINSN